MPNDSRGHYFGSLVFLTLLCLEQGHAFELHQLKWFVQLNET